MMWLLPRDVMVGGRRLNDVRSVSVDRRAETMIAEWEMTGPHPTFVDVPRQTVRVRLEWGASSGEDGGPRPSEEVDVSFRASPSSSGGRATRVRLTMIVTSSLTKSAGGGAGGSGIVRVVEGIALSPDGAEDPVIVERVQGGGG